MRLTRACTGDTADIQLVRHCTHRKVLLKVVGDGGPKVLAKIYLWERVHLRGQEAE